MTLPSCAYIKRTAPLAGQSASRSVDRWASLGTRHLIGDWTGRWRWFAGAQKRTHFSGVCGLATPLWAPGTAPWVTCRGQAPATRQLWHTCTVVRALSRPLAMKGRAAHTEPETRAPAPDQN